MTKFKIGIFGGTFNPIHNGHVNSALTVLEKAKLNEIIVVPAFQNPLKAEVEGPSAEQRTEMVQIAFRDYTDVIKIDRREIQRKGPSYTIDTLNEIRTENPDAELYLILGLDEFEVFDRWKDFEKILSDANLIVTSRPGLNMPFNTEDFPEGLKPLIGMFDGKLAYLKNDKTIEFVRLKDIPASASEIRKRLRTGRGIDSFLDIQVEHFIRGADLYAPVGPKIGDYEQFVKFCANVLGEKKGITTKAFDLRGLEAVTDFTVISSGTSSRHATSLADSVIEAVKMEYGVDPISQEGRDEGRWVVVDYGGTMVHVFYDFVRQQYNLEGLWHKAPEVQV